MRSLQVVLILFFTCSISIAKAQNYTRTSIPVHINIGPSFASFDEKNGTDIRQGLSFFLGLGAGYSVHLNERWTVQMEAQLALHNYDFTIGTTEFLISNITLRTQAGLSRNFPLKKNSFSNLHIGVSGGMSFFQPETLDLSVDGAREQNVAVAQSLNNPFVGLEVGLTQFQGRNKIEMGVMMNYHFTNSPSSTFSFNSARSDAKAQAKGDYIALFIRCHIALPENTAKMTLVSGLDQQKVEARSNRIPKSYDFKQRRVKLKLKDNAQLDGDTVSIQLNGKWIAKNVAISDETQTFIVYLEKGTNELLLFAENEGTVSPNTASLQLISGLRRKKLTTSTSLKRNEVIVLNL
ncbi:MAG: hypothetical protein ACPGWM_03895 [Flavobacteriales bacterium]